MKRIFTTVASKWPEYLLEVLVITIGILGAFALNNWNEDKKGQREEAALLSNIRTDLIKAQNEIDDLNSYRKRILDATHVFYALIRKDQTLPPRQIDSLFAELYIAPTYNSQTGTINALFNSGKITTITNLEIRNELLSWPQAVEDIREEEQYANNYLFRDLLPIVRTYVPIYEMNKYFRINDFISSTEITWTGERNPSAFKGEYDKLLEDIRFEGVLANREVVVYMGIRQTEKLKEKASNIIELIDQELMK